MIRRIPMCSTTVAIAMVAIVLLKGVGFAQEVGGKSADGDAASIKMFEEEVIPVLVDNCLKCHSGSEPKAGLDLSRRERILEGGESGPAVDLTDVSSSILIEAINYSGFEMPPTGQMSDKDIQLLTKWVEGGMAWSTQRAEIEFEHEAGPPQVNDQNKLFWSFRPVSKPPVPEVSRAEWLNNEIDAFVLHKLEERQLQPSSPAEPRELIRRAHYDLLGLPPEKELVERFAANPSLEAYEQIIDELLDSPHYGEKWGRHWLDLVRYAETNSYERDGAKPFVWRYRDYVIQSFNEDKPYDQFVTEQLAGDELDCVTPETMIATGYYRLGRWDDEPADPELAFYDDIDDIVTTTGQTLLGLTINCARCHDHKIDPIPQQDYYSMVAFFRNVRRYGARSSESVEDASLVHVDIPADADAFKAETQEHKASLRSVNSFLAKIDEKIQEDLDDVERQEFVHDMNRLAIVSKRAGTLLTEQEVERYEKQLERRQELLDKTPISLAKALVVKEDVSRLQPTHVLIRGSPQALGEVVEPGFPQILSPPNAVVPERMAADAKTSGRRKELAKWICSPSNPMTARVMVNRLWQYHFGRGIVRSSSDFGFQGTPPTHPMLLDWLAARFVEQDWSIKRMHKLMMMSATYQQSSRGNPAGLKSDPNNDLFWRFDMRRLTAEELRDSILWVSGQLNKDKMFGPSIYTDIPDAVKAGQSRPGSGWGKSSPEDENRRSIYIHAKRSLADPLLEAFDMADMDLSCPVRFVTTQPTQALGMLNSEFVGTQASLLCKFLEAHAADSLAAQVQLALERVTQRPAQAMEIERALALIESLQQEHGFTENQAKRYFC
ncbi:MAG: PSD1 domain-containing protein, partial [Planctomycetales bacterium]|nr:PSD1 domain-containing protein [Planctomycetales bacterium]